MNIKQQTSPANLEKYAFLWSEARLAIAAIALFIGGYPPILKIVSYSLYGLASSLLTVAWIISGVASSYLLYRWYTGAKTLFGGKTQLDAAAFFVSVVSGINLGLTGILGTNIGMTISSNYTVFILVGILYLASAAHLYKRWNTSGRKMF